MRDTGQDFELEGGRGSIGWRVMIGLMPSVMPMFFS